MYISDLALTNFRNYRDQVIAFPPGVITLVGKNGQGKTNAIEAIAYLATFSSHRVAADKALVRQGSDGAVVRAKAVVAGREELLEIEIIAGRANRARLNRGQVRPRDLLGIVHAVVFAPEDLSLVRGDPGVRRDFLDTLSMQMRPAYAALKSDYDKVIRQRSALLKEIRRSTRYVDDTAYSTLAVWDSQLIELGARIMAQREALITTLAEPTDQAYEQISDTPSHAHLTYQPALGIEIPDGDETPGKDENNLSDGAHPQLAEREDYYRESLAAGIEKVRDAELQRAVCLVGPHRDELLLELGTLPAKGYASHGECWSLALALRLASYQVLAQTGPDDQPLLILDDVFAELDALRRARLATMISQAEQVFITAAVGDDLPAELRGITYRVENGVITAPQSETDAKTQAEESNE